MHSFPSTSGAGKSGLRPSHIREASRPASSDLLFRLITEVVNLLLQGEVPDSVRPFVCGASIMALRKPNGTLHPIAVGETFRRIHPAVVSQASSVTFQDGCLGGHLQRFQYRESFVGLAVFPHPLPLVGTMGRLLLSLR